MKAEKAEWYLVRKIENAQKRAVKNAEQWNSPSQHEQQSPQPFSLRNIWSRKGNERHPPPGGQHPPPHIHTGDSAAEEFLGFSIPLVRRGEKGGSQWECEQEYCWQPPHSPGRREPTCLQELSNAQPCPSCSKGLQEAPRAASEQQSLQNWSGASFC